LKKLLVFAMISVHFVSQSNGLQGFSHLLPICGEEHGSSLKAVSELSGDSSAFHKVNDKHNQNFMLPTKISSSHIPDPNSVASFHRFAEKGFFPQNLDNNFYIPDARIHRKDQLVKPQEASPLSLGNVIHEDTESSQVRHRSQFYNPEDFSPFDYSSFFSPNHLEKIYPNTLSTESKAVPTQADQPSSSKNLREVNNKNLEPNLDNIWDLYSISSYPAQDTLNMNQISKSKENFQAHSKQSNLSDRWKIELNYNDDDQNLLEEMLNSHDNQNSLEETLNSRDDQNLFGEIMHSHNNLDAGAILFPSSPIQNHVSRKEPGSLQPSRSSTLDDFEYDKKIENAKNAANKKRKISEILKKNSKTAQLKITKAEIKSRILRPQKEKLIEILRTYFSIKPRNKDLPYEFDIYPNLKWSYKTAEQESIIQEYLNIKILNFLDEVNWEEKTKHFEDDTSNFPGNFGSIPKILSKITQTRTFGYTQWIQWDGSELLKENVSDVLLKLIGSKGINSLKGTLSRIKDISTVGAAFMKIISKIYIHDPRSESFGDDKKILDYTEGIWRVCFSNKKDKARNLASLCESMGAKSKIEIKKCLSIKIENKTSGLSNIISLIWKTISRRGDKSRLLQFAWYFALIRASVFFPEDFLVTKISNGNLNYRKFISNGIMYFVKKDLK
ncbi:expressed protein, partial [Phakopsora pachyrhizi]